MAEGEVPGDYIIERQDLHDVCFLVGSEKEEISSIKLFLANYSAVFRAMLLETDMKEKHSEENIKIPNHEPDVFKLMLSYVYGAQDLKFVDVDQAMRFHLLVDQFLMTKLIAVSSSYLTNNCKNNICDVLKCAVILGIKEMEPRALEMLRSGTEHFVSNNEFKFLDRRIVEFILKQAHLEIEEIHLWRALLSWVKHNENTNHNDGANELGLPEATALKSSSSRRRRGRRTRGRRRVSYQIEDEDTPGTTVRKTLGNMLTYVRFLAMSQKEFAEEVANTSILTDYEIKNVFIALATGKPHGLISLSEERKRLLQQFVLEFNGYSSIKSNCYSVSHTITIKNRRLKLTSVNMRQALDYVSFKLQQNNTNVSTFGPSNCSSFILDTILEANQSYTLAFTTSSGYTMQLINCLPQYSCDYCTVSVNSSSCIKNLTFVLL